MKKNFKMPGSRKLVIQALVKTLRMSIERLDTPQAADQIEYEVERARSGGILDDRTANEMFKNINEIRQLRGWNQDHADEA